MNSPRERRLFLPGGNNFLIPIMMLTNVKYLSEQMMSTTMNSPRRRLVRIPAEMELPPHISTSTSLQKGVLETFISNSTSVRSSGELLIAGDKCNFNAT